MLATKLIPPSSARKLVRRPRLQTFAVELGRAKMALVRAPAGFGKTTLLSQWYQELRALGHAAGWLSFDRNDRDAIGVLGYVVAAIESAGHTFGPEVASIVAPDGYATPDAVVDAVASDLCRATAPIYLFLDDLHVLRDRALDETLASFIDRAPSILHTIVASREIPDMPLARARALGNVVEITASDLRFSKAETAEFMADSGRGVLATGDLDALDGRIEGWVAGLKLAAIALDGDGSTDDVLASISGRGRTFAEFFIEVVIGQQSAKLGDFLLQTAFLDRLTPGLCEAVTQRPGARDALDEIEARGLFIFSLDGERCWYRYHHLFADFLRTEFARRRPDDVRAIHARASRWLAAAGLHDEAFAHAVKADDFVLAADILSGRCHTMFYAGQLRALLDCASSIPEHVLVDYPRVRLAKAWSLILEWKFDEARAILTSVRESFAVRARVGERAAADDMLYLHCTMMLAQFQDDMPTVERQCITLLERGMDADPYLVGTYYTSLLYAEREQFKLLNFERYDARARDYFLLAGSRFVLVWHQSIAGPTRFLAGDTALAIETLRDGLDAAAAIGGRDSGLASIPALLLAEVHYERNELDAATELLDRHLARASELGFVDQLVGGFVTHSRLERLRGDVRAAERALGSAMDLAYTRGFARLRLNIVAEQMAHSLAAGDLDRVVRLAAVHDVRVPLETVLPKSGTTTGTEAHALAWVSLARAEGRAAEGLRVAKRWQRFAELAGARRSEVRWGALVAHLLLLGGDALGAERAFRRTLAAAAPGRFLRTLLDLGRALPLLLAPVAGGPETNDAAASFGRELLRLATGSAAGGASRHAEPVAENTLAPSEPLSPREIEIVELVASGMSNRDIALRLGTTEGTVKWHLHRIFDKIGARRRTQVVHRARRFGLIA
jgi:LuxR family maltose regulon positive regulatory protein